MFEYINTEFMKALMLLFFSLLFARFSFFEKKESKHGFKIFSGILIVLFISLAVGDAYHSKSLATKNIDHFKRGKILYCQDNDFKYRISQDERWLIDKNYFYKDSLMIRADKCSAKGR